MKQVRFMHIMFTKKQRIVTGFTAFLLSVA